MSNILLTCQNLAVYHQRKKLLEIEHAAFEQGKLTAIIGPNGAGKSTLLNALGGNRPEQQNAVYYQGRHFQYFNAQWLAQHRAMLRQQSQTAFPLTVKELVQLGREPYRHTEFAKFSEKTTAWAMEKLALCHLKARKSTALSGGEQHRAHIARVLVQLLAHPDADLSGKWLLLDEPTNHLDIHHQYQLFALLHQLKRQGLTIIAVLHDPALAMNQADHIVMLKNGKKFADKTANDIAAGDLLDQLYQMDMGCRYCEISGQYYLAPKLKTC